MEKACRSVFSAGTHLPCDPPDPQRFQIHLVFALRVAKPERFCAVSLLGLAVNLQSAQRIFHIGSGAPLQVICIGLQPPDRSILLDRPTGHDDVTEALA